MERWEPTALLSPRLAAAAARGTQVARERFGVRRAALFWCARDPDRLVCVASEGEGGPDRWLGRVLAAGVGMAGRAVAEGRPVWSADLLADPRVPVAGWLRERLEHEGLRTVAAAPLRVAGIVRGALGVLDRAGRTYDDRALGRLGLAADEVAAVLGHAMATETWRIRLDGQAAALHGLVAGGAATDLDARPSPGEWSAREHLAHLARHQVAFLDRIGRILVEEAPALGRYRAEDDAGWPAWSGLPVDEVLARHRVGRDRLVAWVTALSVEDTGRVGAHPAFGIMPVPAWLDFFLLHEAHHLYEATVRLAEARARPRPA
jgi:hypothetical protein